MLGYSAYYREKYLVLECFYEAILDFEFTIGQATGYSLYETNVNLKEKNIANLIIISTVLERTAHYKKQKLKFFIDYYNNMMETLKEIDLDKYFNEEEKQDILNDINFIKESFQEISCAAVKEDEEKGEMQS